MAKSHTTSPLPASVSADLRLRLPERVIPRSQVESLLDRCGVASKRERKLPAVFMVYFIITLCLYSSKSMRETLRTVLEECPMIGGRLREAAIASASALSKARTRLGAQVMAELFALVVTPQATKATPGAFFKKYRLVIIDGSTLSLLDTAKNAAAFGGPGKKKGQPSVPMASLVVLVECGTRIIFGVALSRYTTGETKLAKDVLRLLRPGMLCLLDRGYIGYPWLHVAKPSGAEFLIRVRGNMEFPILTELEDGSYLSHVEPPKAARRQGAVPIPVRVIEYRLAGSQERYRVVTTLLNPKKASAQALAEVYHERWEVETTLREVKDYLRGGGLAIFRSQTPELARQELYGYLLAHFVVRRAILDGAKQAKVDSDVLSFTHAWQVITRKLPHLVGDCSPSRIANAYRLLRKELLEERVSSSRGASVKRGVRRYAKYVIRGHGPTSPRQQDFSVQLCPAAA